MLLSCISASAEDFSVDGIYYNITDSEKLTVEVTYRGSYYDSNYDEYTGDVVIPKTVEYIFNTIPVMIIKEELLKKMKDDCIVLDIASMPGGVDKNAALKYGIVVKHILGIPGKYASKSSGEALASDLLKLIE